MQKSDDNQQTAKANRLALIAQRIGFAIWQMQELEFCAAHVLVLATAGPSDQKLVQGRVDELLSRPFGHTLTRLKEAGLLSDDLRKRFDTFRAMRNWLVHKSRSESRSAIHNDWDAAVLGERVDAISDAALALMRELERLAEEAAKAHGLGAEEVATEQRRLLEQWHTPKGPTI